MAEIPSISAETERAEDVRDAADWLCTFIRAAGGGGEVYSADCTAQALELLEQARPDLVLLDAVLSDG